MFGFFFALWDVRAAINITVPKSLLFLTINKQSRGQQCGLLWIAQDLLVKCGVGIESSIDCSEDFNTMKTIPMWFKSSTCIGLTTFYTIFKKV